MTKCFIFMLVMVIAMYSVMSLTLRGSDADACPSQSVQCLIGPPICKACEQLSCDNDPCGECVSTVKCPNIILPEVCAFGYFLAKAGAYGNCCDTCKSCSDPDLPVPSMLPCPEGFQPVRTPSTDLIQACYGICTRVSPAKKPPRSSCSIPTCSYGQTYTYGAKKNQCDECVQGKILKK
jgi:hypothetical protein